MSNGRYIVVEHASGWAVREGDTDIAGAPSKDEALIAAKVLAFAVKAVGGRASVFVQDQTGSLQPYDLDGG